MSMMEFGSLDPFAQFGLFAPWVIGFLISLIGCIFVIIVHYMKLRSSKKRSVDVKSGRRTVGVEEIKEEIDGVVEEVKKELNQSKGGENLKTELPGLDFEAVFKRFDTDGNGQLERDEYENCVKACVDHMADCLKDGLREVVKLQQKGDVNKKIDPNVLLESVFSRTWDVGRMRANVKKVMDPNQDGIITKDEAAKGFAELGFKG